MSHGPGLQEDQFHTVKSSSIRLGATLRWPISDERGILLLSEGQKVTPEFFEHLRSRNIEHLRIHEADLPFVIGGYAQGVAESGVDTYGNLICSEQNLGTRYLDRRLEDPAALALPPQQGAFAGQLHKPPRTAFDEQTRDEFVEHQERSIENIQEVFQRLLSGSGLDLNTLTEIADEALEDLSQDCDLFATLGLNPLSSNFPARHCLHTSMLAISIGTNLKLDRVTLKDLAVGCMIHDAGMLKIDQKVFQSPKRLSRLEFLEITKHPIRIFDLVREVEQISNRSAFVAYQMHERNDGSGYPRGRMDNQIHFLSKVAAVADVYSAIVAPRCYRPAIQPYFAMQQVISMGNSGLLDPNAVRALLETTSMFPLGSYVLLSDGRVGRTIRANGLEFDSPVVETWEPGRLNHPPEVIDLVGNTDVAIIRAIPRLDLDLSELNVEQTVVDRSVQQILDLVDLSDGCESDDLKKQRISPRHSFRQELSVYYIPNAEEEGWKTSRFQGRNISRGGISMVGNCADLPREVVVLLQQGEMEPVYLQAHVVRQELIRDEWWEYGLRFLRKVESPSKNGKFTVH